MATLPFTLFPPQHPSSSLSFCEAQGSGVGCCCGCLPGGQGHADGALQCKRTGFGMDVALPFVLKSIES